MIFQNLPVNWETLPRSADATLKSIEKDYLKVLYITWAIVYTLLLAGVVCCLVFIDKMQTFTWILSSIGGWILLVAATFIIVTGSFRRKAYALREKDVLYRTGWIFQKLHIVPFSRIQHCVVQSGPIERKFGLAGISIYTAASSIQDISIKGLKPDEAETLKAFIIQQIQPLS